MLSSTPSMVAVVVVVVLAVVVAVVAVWGLVVAAAAAAFLRRRWLQGRLVCPPPLGRGLWLALWQRRRLSMSRGPLLSML